ncbi:glycerophosphodiester phosphodiesterase family protein [Sporosarcina sp. GW1-11]|uniref:glycerophosphodiester phosphodiesterase n=1 Tax=Sporosarcina sp. GW1-11 TaxID=2899126 RepID=UPI00294F0F37|nr:glycerophosphodiester phosphodiesterase family protein [Sporosarcina sp. GW1-11]MDV6379233.1 glycerophosphodiester phosphodiesterase family protein [Sporosarcina sp. GW1-11]
MFDNQVFAHRGASASHVENTMSAFKAAVKKGADGIELDVQKTKDGNLFVIHDDNLHRLTSVDQQIDQLTATELQRMKVGKSGSRWIYGHPIPLLFDVVAFCREHNLALNIELKQTVYGQREVIQRILDYVDGLENVHLSSFDYETMRLVREESTAMETALLVKKKTVDWSNLSSYDVDALHFHKRLWKEPYRTALIESGKTLRMYGVTGEEPFLSNSPEVTGWITDYPKRLRKKLK